MQADTICSTIYANAERLKKLRDESRVPMKLEAYTKLMEEREAEAKRFDQLGKTVIPGVAAVNPGVDMGYIQADSSRIARNDNWINNVHKDFQLNEAMHILFDLIAQDPKITQQQH